MKFNPHNVICLLRAPKIYRDQTQLVSARTCTCGDSGRAVEAFLEAGADGPEVRQTHPTRLHRAAAGHPVAFALATHERPIVRVLREMWSEKREGL